MCDCEVWVFCMHIGWYAPFKCIYVRTQWWGNGVIPFRHRRCSGHSMPPTPCRSSWNSSPLVGTAPTGHVTNRSRHQLMSPAHITSSRHQLMSPTHGVSLWAAVTPLCPPCPFSNGQCSCTDSLIQQSQQGCGGAVQPSGGWVGGWVHMPSAQHLSGGGVGMG